ncbi:MAG TPA: hypothetical protein PLW09_11750 [Candidatus Kapabacteria bacterium]|nr:hypothetical protein [Candidatus Kapabacteria bacterium]
MKSNVLQAMVGIEVFPLISLIIFVGVFTAMFIWVFKMDKSSANSMAEIPLQDGNRDEIFNRNL